MIVADLSFEDRQLEAICHDDRLAVRALGPQAAKRLGRRLKELQSSEDPNTLKSGPGSWHDLHHDWEGHVSGTVSGGDRIVVRHTKNYANNMTVWHIACIGDCYDH